MSSLFSMEYYIILPKFGPDVPLLASDKGNPKYLFRHSKIDNPELMRYRFRGKVKKPRMLHFMFSPHAIISEDLWRALRGVAVGGVQYLPCKIRGNGETEYTGYHAVHAYTRIQALDMEKSICNYEDDSLSNVERLVLDEAKLDQIPLEDRLIFRLKEDSGIQLFHRSVKDIIVAITGDDVRVYPIGEWNESSIFQ